jgi:tetratricopeptide (TPR) repeat protein
MWPTLSGRGRNNTDQGRVPVSQIEGIGEQQSGADAAPGPGQLSGTPREQADRLFNRIMTEREGGDTARAKFFLPMGIQAYEMVSDLDADGLYHLSLLQAFSGDYKAARSSAEQVLKTQPKHLLALSAAAQAARSQNDEKAARDYYRRFLENYDAELKSGKEEYRDHSRILPDLKKEAQQFTAR